MEFIPLERYSRKSKVKESVNEQEVEKVKKVSENETSDEVVGVKKRKAERHSKAFEKKNIKNKYRETLGEKQKVRVVVKKTQKKKRKKEEEEEDDEVEEKEEKEEEMEVDNEDSESEEEEKNDDEEKFNRKCKEMDNRKKNRLFVKLSKKISNKAQIKELHPDIRDVIFPRKRNSRWCWAVFASEERADQAMKQLIKKKDVLISKPTPHDKVDLKKKQKMKTVLRKKEARKKLQNMWM